ncbi:GyrI-like domain-containing protein [Monashia sp. NPDC004114]
MTITADSEHIDLLYRATTTPRLVRVPRLTFLCLDGHGDPNTSPAYAAAVQALYSVSYAAKFALKKAGGPDFKVSPLEGLWWAEDMSTFLTGDKSAWDWTMMIRQPDAVTADLVARLAQEAAAKKSIAAATQLRLVSFEEGAAAQVLHVGPYATEAPTIARLHEFIREQGFTFDGPGHSHKHHEIYIGDPRRSAPEKLRTIIRQPYAVS